MDKKEIFNPEEVESRDDLLAYLDFVDVMMSDSIRDLVMHRRELLDLKRSVEKMTENEDKIFFKILAKGLIL
jgi:hypothetical protein